MTVRAHNLAKGWPFIVAIACVVGYLYASIPPQILDPIFQHHVRYSGRLYNDNWLTVPLAALVLLMTWLLANRRANPVILILPLVAATVVTNGLVFPQEFPHLHVIFVTAVWSALTATWVWIRYSCEDALEKVATPGNSTLEYVKEQVLFFRTLAFGLVAAFLALLVAALVAMHSMTGSVTLDKSEAFLLLVLNGFTMAMFGLFALFGPVHEALRSWRLLALQLMQPKLPEWRRKRA